MSRVQSRNAERHLWHQSRIANDAVHLPCVPDRDCGHFCRAPLALSVGECPVQFGTFYGNILRKKLARLSNKASYVLCLPIQVACGSFVDPVHSAHVLIEQEQAKREIGLRNRSAKSGRSCLRFSFANVVLSRSTALARWKHTWELTETAKPPCPSHMT